MIPGIVASQLIFGGGGTSLLGTASINFITGVYTVEGASVTAAEIIDTPSEIDGGGLHIDLSGTPIEILSPLLDILLTPTWTIVLEIEATSLAGNVWLLSFAQMPVGGTNDTMQVGIGDIGFSDEIFVYDDNGSGGSRQVSTGATTTLGVHRIAISREDTRLSMSVDGESFVTDTTDEPIPLFTAVTFGNFSGDTNGRDAYIRTFTVMAIQPDNVLESLSALEEETGEAIGTATGIGVAAAVGSSIGGPTAAVGSASALGSAVATSAQIMAAVGTAAGLGSATGVGEDAGVAYDTFLGALASNAGDLGSTNKAAGEMQPWGAETADSSAIHSTSVNTTRLTIPAGLNGKYGIITAQLSLGSVVAGAWYGGYIVRGGTVTLAAVTYNNSEHAAAFINVSTPPVLLATGDYFEVSAQCSDTATTLAADQSGLGIHIVG